MNTQDLLNKSIEYFIVISDFGRDAAVEFIDLISKEEKKIIKEIIEFEGFEFYDEYRRIMFTMIGDVAFLKEKSIARNVEENGFINDDVLIGLGSSTKFSQEFFDRISLTFITEAIFAFSRGYKRIHLVIPCNTLSDIADDIGSVIKNRKEIRRLFPENYLMWEAIEKVKAYDICVHTVPESVMRFLSSFYGTIPQKNVLIIGTRGTMKIYQRLSSLYSINIVPIPIKMQGLIDKAIVASIDGTVNTINSMRTLLIEDLIKPYKEKYKDLIIIEACTDFHFNVGLSSLKALASVIVSDCYNSFNSSIC